MNRNLTRAMTPEEQAGLLAGICGLLDGQVKSYQKHHRLGQSTSVTAELAKELAESLFYTLEKARGLRSEEDLEEALARGRQVLEQQLALAEEKLHLVEGTMPETVNRSYRSTLAALKKFLRQYDLNHLAHRTPDFLEYPLLASDWQDLRGLDQVNAYLDCLWQENQILAGAGESAVPALYGRMDPDFRTLPMSLCEQVLINGLGLAALGRPAESLRLLPFDRAQLAGRLNAQTLDRAMDALCREWDLAGPAADYARLVLPGLEARAAEGDLSRIFL